MHSPNRLHDDTSLPPHTENHPSLAFYHALQKGDLTTAKELLLSNNFPLNDVIEGEPLLHHAARYSESITRQMMENPKLDLLQPDSHQKTLFSKLQKGKITVSNSLYNRIAKRSLEAEEGNTPYSFVTQLLSDKSRGPLPATKALKYVTYCDTTLSHDDIGDGYKDYYQIAELRPIMDIAALAALGKHKRGKEAATPKHLRIYAANEADTDKIHRTDTPFVTENNNDINALPPSSEGLYMDKHAVFAVDSDEDDLVVTILHELVHFAVMEVYNNQCKPYYPTDESNHPRKKRIHALIDGFEKSPESISSDIIRKTLRYPREERAAELIAHAFEMICVEGVNALKSEHPELYSYVQQFNNACMEYLQQHNAENYVERYKEKSRKIEAVDYSSYTSNFSFNEGGSGQKQMRI